MVASEGDVFKDALQMVLLISSSYSLQFKRGPEHDGAAAEGVVVGVGVDAVEDGVGVVALV